MSQLEQVLDHAEALADVGDFPAALAHLASHRGRAEAEARPRDSAEISMASGAITARAGDLDGALSILEHAAAAATAVGADLVALEARVTHCSVLAALGDFDRAIPALRDAVARLSEIQPGGELHRDAEAELLAYTNLTGE
jgi:tetratricopeptide (TPR) repeat protein